MAASRTSAISGSDWLVIIAIALSITFIIAAQLNSIAHNFYAYASGFLKHFETAKRLIGDAEDSDFWERVDPARSLNRYVGLT
jgi:hypothetical protein